MFVKPSPNRIALLLAVLLGLLGALLPSARAQVRITEFMANNTQGLVDEDGDHEDWIEINNAGTTAVDLGGWSLTDDPAKPTQWVFPTWTLGPGQYLVVFASGKDRRGSSTNLHTNFKLSAGGEYLALIRPGSAGIATEFAPAYPPQVENVSYGILPSSIPVSLLSGKQVGRFQVPADDRLGLGWVDPDFNDSTWRKVTNAVGFDAAGAQLVAKVADSTDDWSTSGAQGFRGWSYGYYLRSADANGSYSAPEFVPFPTNYWNGSFWRWPSATFPWDLLSQTVGHPTGTNSGSEHWVIRRWTSSVAGTLSVQWTLKKSGNLGNGVTGRLYFKGLLRDSLPLTGGDVVGQTRTVTLTGVAVGDPIDLVLAPQGASGAGDDVGDTAITSMTLSTVGSLASQISSDVGAGFRTVTPSAYIRYPFVVSDADQITDLSLILRYDDGFAAWLNGEPIASRNAPVAAVGGVIGDSVADWSSAGLQGENGWYYGFYDKTGDADGVYNAFSDFVSTASQWAFVGGSWFLGPGDPPWDFIGSSSWHPNTGGGVHWVIRRWISEAQGDVKCAVKFAKENLACGNGVTLRVLVNGVEKAARSIAFNDGVGISETLTLSNLAPGDFVDFALDPRGPDGVEADGCDGSTFMVTITQAPSPGLAWNSPALTARTPAQVAQPVTIGLAARRRLLVAGTNVLCLQGLNASAGDPTFFIDAQLNATLGDVGGGLRGYALRSTPGSANSGGTLVLGPRIDEVSHTPQVAKAGSPLQVTATILKTLNPIGTVSLTYRVMHGAEVVIPMLDNGLSGDGVAGDGVYGAQIPGSAFAAGQMIRYFITARDSLGQSSQEPAFLDPLASPRYRGTIADDPSLSTSRLPVIHWFIQDPASASLETGGRGSLFFEGEFHDNVTFGPHGQSTRGFPKPSIDVDFNPGDSFQWRKGEPRVNDINLLTTWADKSHMRNVLAYETFAAIGAPGHFAIPVRLQQNGAFHSVANMVETGDRHFLERVGLDPRGALYKMYNSAESTAGAEKKSRREEGTEDLNQLIVGMSQADVNARRRFMMDNLDLPEVVNYLAGMTLVANTDCCHKNYYLYRDSDGSGEWQAMPWDLDLSFGRVWTCGTPCMAYFDELIYTNTPLFVGLGNVVFTPVFDAPETRQMYLRRLRTILDQRMQPPTVASTNDLLRLRTLALRDQIAPTAALDLAKWGTWGTRETITQAVNRIWNEFLPGRRRFLYQNQLAGQGGEIPPAQDPAVTVRIARMEFRPSSRIPEEEFVMLTNANAVAVDLSGWTLDGGVRFTFKGGTVIPARSSLYVSPNTRAFRARSVSPKGGERLLVTGPYSGMLSAWGESLLLSDPAGRLVSSNGFAADPSPAQRYLRITEIHYHPAPVAGGVPDSEQFEFIELQNVGPQSLDLLGVKLTGGVFFAFTGSAVTQLAPGARVVVVKDLAAFRSRYGASPLVAGVYTGFLDNTGESLRLEDAWGEKILEFRYDNQWHPITDGLGFSLVIVDPLADWTLWGERESWRPSGSLDGNPGAGDVPRTFPAVVVNEILAHTDLPQHDAIELWNLSGQPADVSGWYLTDDFYDPKKYRIPQGNVLPPFGFLLLDDTAFNAGPRPFLLTSTGEEVWLFSAGADGNLTGYHHGFHFGATKNGTTLGRYVNADGGEDLVLQSLNTLGASNAPPAVGPIVISEIFYHPEVSVSLPDELAEFLELHNASATDVPLYDPNARTNTWRLREAVDFNFPTNLVLAAGSRLLVVGFDPLQTTITSAFRTRYGIPAQVPILGPWSGQLDNAGESVELLMPDPPNTNGIPYVRVERIHYRDQAPWPLTADGLGASLQRRVALSYGNESSNWFAASPTPGKSNGLNLPPEIAWVGPAAGVVIPSGSNVVLQATASDPEGFPVRVQFLEGEQILSEMSAPPFTWTWVRPSPGSHTVFARVYDVGFGIAQTTAVTFRVESVPPTVALLSPTADTAWPLGQPLRMAAEANALNGSIARVLLIADGVAVADLNAAPYEFLWTPAVAGVHRLWAEATDTLGKAATSSVVRIGVGNVQVAPITLISLGSRWRYLDNGTDQGTNWLSPLFNDAGWSNGLAQLGYGDGDEITRVDFGGNAANKYITTYFRSRFAVTNVSQLSALQILLMRDDGAAVYLNGSPLFRSALPDGDITYRTLANATAGGADETNLFPFPIDLGFLREGTNVLCVEVHQAAVDSSDLSFDLSFAGQRSIVAPIILDSTPSASVIEGQPFSLTVVAAGTPPLSYAWERLGAGTVGRSNLFSVSSATAAMAGAYRCIVSNAAGSATSAVAQVVVQSSNKGPVASPDAWVVLKNLRSEISHASLLANDSDPDGDVLSVSLVDTVSQAGGKLESLPSAIAYTPVAGFLGADAFSYRVSDGRGGISTGRVDIAVLDPPIPALMELRVMTAPTPTRFRFRGTPRSSVRLERSLDLIHWEAVVTMTVPANGILEVEDPSPAGTKRFYRMAQP